MMTMKSRSDLTYRYNSKNGRHGWLRLTPAYSVKIVHQILDSMPNAKNILDPFSGTGTTGLVCAERGLTCQLLDINPFLIWLARVKTANYSSEELAQASDTIQAIVSKVEQDNRSSLWQPPIYNIDRWWSREICCLLSQILSAIRSTNATDSVCNLLLITFCKKLIEWSNAAFNHQSMSFKKEQAAFIIHRDDLIAEFVEAFRIVVATSEIPIEGTAIVSDCDSRNISIPITHYDCVITSPPYPNRMSYIRELRPYMYWLGYLQEAREAGELDWQAIGGTWGIATSRVAQWESNGSKINHPEFDKTIASISKESHVLANYVHKYFVDIQQHLASLYPYIAIGGKVFYIVGNSKFYETVVPVEQFYSSILQHVGFGNVTIEAIRKRNSKKELFEYIVSAEKL